MQIKVKTETLQNLVNKVSKGMGNNKMLPITEMIGINIDNNKISLLATDGMNKLEVISSIENIDNVKTSIAVNGNNFTKLVQKTTTEFISLLIEDNKLTIKGNGSYIFALPLDEDNNIIKMDSIDLSNLQTTEVSSKELKDSYSINKESVATTMEVPSYTGFYFDESGAIATNSLKISYVKNSLLKNPVLLYNSFASLFSLIDEEKVTIGQNNSEIFIITPTLVIKGQKMTEITDFPVSDIKPFLETEMPHSVRVNKQALLNLLERISIFVTPYDKNGIKVEFTKNGLLIWTIKGDNNELLPYTSTNNLTESKITVDVTNFKALVSSNPEEEVTIHYGSDVAIKMTFGNVIQIMSLQED